MACREIRQQEREVSSAETAAGYVRRMVEWETRGWGDQENALSRIGRKHGLAFWTLNNLRTGRAKTVEAGLFGRIRAAYLAICESQIAKLEQEIAIEKAITCDDTLENLESEARRLAAQIAAARTKRQSVT
jgi:hypothetical protein